jgi:hypothetical protein
MAAESVDMVARTFHTVDGVAHAEGEAYTVTDRAMAETLRGIGFVSIAGWTDAPSGSAPTVTTLVPATVPLGAPNFTVRVLGTGFTPDPVIVWNGIDVPTTVVSDTEVTTDVDMAVWLAPATVPVAVRAGGVESASVSFTFTPAAWR